MQKRILEEHKRRYAKPDVRTKRPTMPFIPSDRASRRVIAPYLSIVRKDKKLVVKDDETNRYMEAFLRKKPSILMSTLKEFVDGMVEMPILIHESIDALRAATAAVGARLYLVDDATNEIFISPQEDPFPRNRLSFKIETGKTIAAHVAKTQDVILCSDILVDKRFPQGVPFVDLTVKSIVCAPILTANGVCYGVVELYRDCSQKPFTMVNAKIVLVLLGWIGTAIQRNNQRARALHQRQLNDCLIELTRTYFENNISIDKVINELVKFAKSAVNAERASLFIVHPDNELIADVYDEGLSEEGNNLVKRYDKVKFFKDKGIAAYVAKTKESIIVQDAYNDSRFPREVDQSTGLVTRSVLCTPIIGMNKLLGIIQAVNKATGECFTEGDEELFKTFATYCGLSLQYNGLFKLYSNANARYQIMSDLLKRHVCPSESDVNQLRSHLDFKEDKSEIDTFQWYINLNRMDEMPQIATYLILSVAEEGDINVDQLYRFVLSVKNFYRNNPYHNWEHGFNVAHCMSTILKHNKQCFNRIEKKSLVVAALGHDIDHGGVTNTFLHLANDKMAELYDDSTWEHHHYDVTMMLLGEMPIFNNCTNEEYKEIASVIRVAILATDLANYFKTSTKLKYILEDNHLDMSNLSHRSMLIGVMMTACDLSGQCKDFDVAQRITTNLYNEFYEQGDREKEIGYIPLSMMDREKKVLIPSDQVNFLNILVIPCCDLLRKCLPNTSTLCEMAFELKTSWMSIVSMQNEDVWWTKPYVDF